ncbi:hypothetical protein L596_018958 [Steinernema carpocapsae]|uniref:Uncharacterized protein n=1 Tax=Steinernema carpocapsae TaxID=34508 RepID=A0A4U5N675_STECR|nr:hypothetical protein L596_018958 [Steinernema carpocapsae]
MDIEFKRGTRKAIDRKGCFDKAHWHLLRLLESIPVHLGHEIQMYLFVHSGQLFSDRNWDEWTRVWSQYSKEKVNNMLETFLKILLDDAPSRKEADECGEFLRELDDVEKMQAQLDEQRKEQEVQNKTIYKTTMEMQKALEAKKKAKDDNDMFGQFKKRVFPWMRKILTDNLKEFTPENSSEDLTAGDVAEWERYNNVAFEFPILKALEVDFHLPMNGEHQLCKTFNIIRNWHRAMKRIKAENCLKDFRADRKEHTTEEFSRCLAELEYIGVVKLNNSASDVATIKLTCYHNL